MKPVRIKICGITRGEDVRTCADEGVNALGLNFVPESPRFVSLDRACELIASAPQPGAFLWAGVFVNPSIETACEAAARLGLRIVQLHGEESPAFLSQLRQRLAPEVQIWKAVRVASRSDLAQLAAYACEAWLIDSKVAGARGGSGQSFDWTLLREVPRTVPVVLSGGLNPRNVAAAIREVHPDWVDTASGVEARPGQKKAELIRNFVREANKPQCA